MPDRTPERGGGTLHYTLRLPDPSLLRRVGFDYERVIHPYRVTNFSLLLAHLTHATARLDLTLGGHPFETFKLGALWGASTRIWAQTHHSGARSCQTVLLPLRA